MTHFQGTEYRSHTSCISEAQKYQGHLYREKKPKAEKRKSLNGPDATSTGMVPRKAYFEDVPEGGDDSQVIAVVDVPPRAPTPPPAAPPPAELTQDVNVFDFLVTADVSKGTAKLPAPPNKERAIEKPARHTNGDVQHYQQPPNTHDHKHFHPNNHEAGIYYEQNGFAYGNGPVPPSMGRYDSWPTFVEGRPSSAYIDPAFKTPAPKEHRKDKRVKLTSEKKRKRYLVEELDLSTNRRPSSRDEPMSDAAVIDGSGGRVLHSGLTGGLSRLITDVDFQDDRINAGPTPSSPVKRSKRNNDTSATTTTKNDRRKSSYASYSTTTTKAPLAKVRTRSRSPDRAPSRNVDETHRRHRRRDSYDSDDDRPGHQRTASSRTQTKAIEYPPARPGSVQPHADNQIVAYNSRADLFMSFVKGPESLHGASINKILKRYHRERDVRSDDREDDDKELWKALRVRKNDRGEIVLFVEEGL